MPQPTNYTPLYSSSPYRDMTDEEEQEEFFLQILECDDFWWDEEERHELF